MTTRIEFARKTKAAAFARCGGRCEGRACVSCGHNMTARAGIEECDRCGDPVERCGALLTDGRFRYDHRVPDWIGGAASLENCQVICWCCDAPKTAADQGTIAKIKRIRDKRIKAKVAKRPMPFGRGSALKKKIGGAVVPRERR